MAHAYPESPYVAFPKDRRRATRLWETFNAKGVQREDLLDPYDRMLVAEWQRCRHLGIDPTLHEATVLPDAEFRGLLDRRAYLLQKARPVLERVEKTLSGLSGILIFTDHEGTILHVSGDPAVRLKAEEHKLVEGGCWGEATSGTNGIGTAIAKKSPVHVYSSEHFCEGWHIWTCAGAPVLDPATGEVLGVVDFTAFESDFQPGAMNLAVSVAANITEEMRVQLELERLQLVHHYSIYASRFPNEVVLVYDRRGRLVRHTPGIDPREYGSTVQDLTVLKGDTRELRPLLDQNTKAAIGTVVVAAFRSAEPSGLWLPEEASSERSGQKAT